MVNKSFKILVLSLLSALALDSITWALPQLPPIKPGMPGKKRGDIIAPMLDEQIAAWCDFSKQIIMTHSNILCVYVGDKNASENQSAKARSPVPKKFAKFVPKDLKPSFYEMNEYGDGQEAT